MKSQKDIESIIREGEKNLRIQPSGRAWNKLERRLDTRRLKNGTIVSMRKWMAVAATLLVLVFSLFIWSADGEPDYDYLPAFVEELEGTNDCNPFCMNLEAWKKLPAFYAVPTKDELKEHS